MVVYSVVVFLTAAVFAGISISIYRGNTGLIHDFHQTKVKDKKAYGKAFAKALSVMTAAMLMSGIMSLWACLTVPTVWVLIAGLCLGTACIIAVQRKYNKGIF